MTGRKESPVKTKFGIIGCGFLGRIVAQAWKDGLLPDYELAGVPGGSPASPIRFF